MLLKNLMEGKLEDAMKKNEKAAKSINKQKTIEKKSESERALKNKKYNDSRKKQHEEKMKTDPEYRKEVEKTGNEWKSYGDSKK